MLIALNSNDSVSNYNMKLKLKLILVYHLNKIFYSVIDKYNTGTRAHTGAFNSLHSK